MCVYRCTVGKLGDGVCDSACNTRQCSNDNRDCASPDVVVSLLGNDVTGQGTFLSPVATLSRAAAMACSGFVQCLPIRLMPGTYDCASTLLNKNGVELTITPYDTNLPAPLLTCSDASYVDWALPHADAHLTFTCTNVVRCARYATSRGQSAQLFVNTSSITLEDVTLVTSLSAVSLSTVTLNRVTVMLGSSVSVQDGLATLDSCVMAGGSVTLDDRPTRISA